ncbi:MAG: hypothetical protein KOO66_01075 [Bacteroidales bacterium]|nr:hypothetical protein [Bacteroidales bacterium]
MNLNSFKTEIKDKIKLRNMKYISDQEGIMRRYIRERHDWNIHIKETKNFILKSAKTKEKNRVVVLGSGWLLDLPLKELSEIFNEIILIDIYHPKQIRRKAKEFSNVTLQTNDITGGLIDFFYKNRKKKVLFSSADSFKYLIPKDTDFVISLNILCQLHIILIDYLKKFGIYSVQELKTLEKQIQLSHLTMLPKEKTCLITDYEEEIYDEDNILIGINPLLHFDLPNGNFSNKWQWKFDSLMTYRDNAKTFFNTTAIDF